MQVSVPENCTVEVPVPVPSTSVTWNMHAWNYTVQCNVEVKISGRLIHGALSTGVWESTVDASKSGRMRRLETINNERRLQDRLVDFGVCRIATTSVRVLLSIWEQQANWQVAY